MASLLNKIKLYVGSEVDFTTDVILQDDMVDGVSNPYIREWNLDIAKPTQEQLDALETEAQAEEELQEFKNARATAYPSIQEQLDMQYWDKVNGTTNWEDAIAKVKSDIPKA
tara:strand:- start:609 stop:944 length:336 start_codon:yes stop_codon:yes gene_type:complete